MPIYEKPTRELMHEFAAQRLKPGQVFSRKDAVRWFADHYPDIKSNTVACRMSVHSPRRRHNPRIRPGAGWDLFFKLSPANSAYGIATKIQPPVTKPISRQVLQTASSRRTNSPRRPPRKKTSVRESSRSSETFRTISPKTSDFWNPA